MSDVFQRTKDALLRAAYRGILGREPDEEAARELKTSPFSSEEELELKTILTQFVESDESRSRYKGEPVLLNYPPSTWARVEVDDMLLWVDLGDLGVSRNCMRGDYEPHETAFVRGLLKPGMTFVDIGANIGWFSVNAAKLVGPQGRVFAFEPRNDSFAALTRSFQDNGFLDRATLVNAAVGEKPGEMFIGWHSATGNPGGTWSVPHEGLEHNFRHNGGDLQRTPVIVLDDIVGDAPVDVIKIDIEGAEPIALLGATGLLKNQKPIILCEVNPILLAQVSRTSPQAFIESVEAQGYACHALNAEGVSSRLAASSIGVDDDMVNVVFMPAVGRGDRG